MSELRRRRGGGAAGQGKARVVAADQPGSGRLAAAKKKGKPSAAGSADGQSPLLLVFVPIVLASLVFVLYLQTLLFTYLEEDVDRIILHPDVVGQRVTLKDMFSHDAKGQPIDRARGVTFSSYAPVSVLLQRWLRVRFSLDNPGYMHLAQVGLYAVLCMQYFSYVRVIGDGYTPILLSTTFLFALHPIHVQAVASFSGIADLLATTLVVFALRSYDAAVRQDGRTTWSWYLVFVLAAVAAVLSSEQAVCLVVLALMQDVWACFRCQGRRSTIWSHGLARNLATLTLASLACYARALCLGYNWEPVPDVVDNPIVGAADALTRIRTAGYYTARAVGTMLAPVYQSPSYASHAVDPINDAADPRNTFSALLLVLLVALVGICVLARRVPRIWSRILLYTTLMIAPLLPVTSLLFPAPVALREASLLMPSLGASLLLGYIFACPHIAKAMGGRAVQTFLLVVLCVAFAATTATRTGHYASDEDLGTATLAAEPSNAYGHVVLARALLSQDGQADTAVQHLDAALALDNRLCAAGALKGEVLANAGKPADSVALLRTAFQCSSGKDDRIIYAYVSALLNAQETTHALRLINGLIERRPYLSQAHFQRARVLRQQGDAPAAMDALYDALDVSDGRDADAQFLLALMHRDLGDLYRAARHAQAARRWNPDHEQAAQLEQAMVFGLQHPDQYTPPPSSMPPAAPAGRASRRYNPMAGATPKPYTPKPRKPRREQPPIDPSIVNSSAPPMPGIEREYHTDLMQRYARRAARQAAKAAAEQGL